MWSFYMIFNTNKINIKFLKDLHGRFVYSSILGRREKEKKSVRSKNGCSSNNYTDIK